MEVTIQGLLSDFISALKLDPYTFVMILRKIAIDEFNLEDKWVN